ncbi:MAG: tetratricopeptide repeat protein [Nevskia sp.]|nr:tetratricopeptide repeat protein [Nevskia sp.]
MKHLALLAAGLLLAFAAHAADGGSSLWLTADQRGERLLQQGDAAAAAQTYADPRRKAYAELRAGDYAASAHDLAGLDDSDAHYNRGNALVGAGKLEDAIKAYDTALARNPDNRDARHNRDLVEQALKQQQQRQQQQQQQGKGGQGQPQQGQQGQQQQGQQQAQQGQQQAQQGQQGRQQGQQQNASADGAQPSGKDTQAQKDNPSTAGKDSRQADGRDKAGQDADKGEQQAAASPEHAAGQPPGHDATPAADEAEQARRDAANSLKQQPAHGQAQVQQANGASNGGPLAGDTARVEQAPRTEEQLAQEQWLRRIPDDPGGLLRRKFMIEHMMREKNQQP